MWNLKNKTNKQNRNREHFDGCHWEGGKEKYERIKKHKLVVTKLSWRCKVQHREYSQ